VHVIAESSRINLIKLKIEHLNYLFILRMHRVKVNYTIDESVHAYDSALVNCDYPINQRATGFMHSNQLIEILNVVLQIMYDITDLSRCVYSVFSGRDHSGAAQTLCRMRTFDRQVVNKFFEFRLVAL
jgi:hypothetical protein